MDDQELFDAILQQNMGSPAPDRAEVAPREQGEPLPEGDLFDSLLRQNTSRSAAPQSPEQEEESDRTVASDIFRGAGAGVVGLAQGIAELGAMGADLAFDTDYANAVTTFFQDGKEALGLDPETGAGRAAEGLTNFGIAFIPIAGWLGRAGQAARGVQTVGRASRFGRSAEAFGRTALGRAATGTRARLATTTTLAGGVSDFFVSPDGTGTLSDAFDALPDFLETEEASGLTGRDDALRRLRNKLRVGLEGTAFGAAAEAIFPAARVATTAVSRLPGVPQAARVAVEGLERMGELISRAPKARRLLTSAGETPQSLFRDLESTEAFTTTMTREAESALVAFDRAASQSFAPALFKRLIGRGRSGMDKAYDDLFRYLQGNDDALDQYGQQVVRAGSRMRDQVRNMSEIILKQVETSDLSPTVKQQIVEIFQNNMNQYIRRLYRRFEDPNWLVPEGVAESTTYNQAVREVTNILAKMDEAAVARRSLARPRDSGQLIADAEREVNRMIGLDIVNAGLDPKNSARILAENMRKAAGRTALKGDAPLYRLGEGILKERSKFMENAPALRELMGEIKDPRQAYLRTIGDMAQFVAANRLYQQTSRTLGVTAEQALELARNGGRPLVIQGPGAESVAASLGYRHLSPAHNDALFGGTYGALEDAWVAPEIYNALTIPHRIQTGLEEAIAVSLQAKGLAQEAVTVYSPIAQVRNFLSNIFVTLANGNVMRDLPFGDAMRLTVGKASNLDDKEFKRLFEIMGNLGLRDQNLQVSEFNRLMREGATGRVSGKTAERIQSIKDRIPFGRALENVYGGTDTYWKTANWLAERAKYTNAFRRAGIAPDAVDNIADDLVRAGLGSRTSELTGTATYIDTLAGDIVKNTTPTYSRVPEMIRDIRRIPVIGNFVAFPAEVVRNSANILDQSLREMSFTVSDEVAQSLMRRGLTQQNLRQLERQIRAIGAQRLAGYVSAAALIPMATAKAARDALGWSEEQVDALEAQAPYYAQGHQLVPITRAGDPNVEYVDLSYMMPYDFVLAPARAALQAYSEAGRIDAGIAAQIREAAFAGLGKLMEPFASESLVAERVGNILLRGGTTRTGLDLYTEGTPFGEKLQRGFLHIVGGFVPGYAQLLTQERGGEFVSGRGMRALTGVPSASGQPYDTAEELGAIVSGMRPMQLRLTETFRYRGHEYNQLRRAAVGVFGRVAKANDSTAEDVLNAYDRANAQLRTQQARLYADIQQARELGLRDIDIIRSLREANIGREEIALIMQGRFRPVSLSSDLVRTVLREGQNERRVLQTLPVSDIVGRYAQLVNTPLVQPETVPVEEEAAPAAPVVDQEPAAQVPQTPARQALRTSPLLMGDNPADVLANLQIAQRTPSGQ